MKSLLVTLLLTASFFILNGCKEAIVVPASELERITVPVVQGSYYIYSVDSAYSGASTGRLSVNFTGSTLVEGTPYITGVDTVQDGTVQNYYLRTSQSGVYAYVYTTGFGALIPDTLKRFVTVDKELTLLSQPFFPNKTWNAYKLIVLNLSIISLKGEYLRTEKAAMQLNGITDTIMVHHCRYNLTVNLIDSVMTYTAEVGFADKLGIVTMEGSEFLLQFMKGIRVATAGNDARIKARLIEYTPILYTTK